jgi:hypothetical protein
MIGLRTTPLIEVPSPLLLAIKEWQRQLVLKQK